MCWIALYCIVQPLNLQSVETHSWEVTANILEKGQQSNEMIIASDLSIQMLPNFVGMLSAYIRCSVPSIRARGLQDVC